jgi:YggT family protein
VHTVFAAVALVLLLFYLLILARIVFDVTRSFARQWRPVGSAAVGLELLYSSTDPPVKTLRRMIPPLRLGSISIDLSVWLLLFGVWLLRYLFLNLAGG